MISRSLSGLTCCQFPARWLESVVRGRQGEVGQSHLVAELAGLAGLLPRIARQEGVEGLPPALAQANVLELLHRGAEADLPGDRGQLGQRQAGAGHPGVPLDQLFRWGSPGGSQSPDTSSSSSPGAEAAVRTEAHAGGEDLRQRLPGVVGLLVHRLAPHHLHCGVVHCGKYFSSIPGKYFSFYLSDPDRRPGPSLPPPG